MESNGNNQREIKITLAKQPLRDAVKSLCEISGENNYFIVVNSSLNADEQAKSFLHECLHIWHDDFNIDAAIDDLEAARHDELNDLLAEGEQWKL